MSKRGLGRGLDALIPQLNVSDHDHVVSVDVRDLRPNPYQPRREFNEEKLHELSRSILEHGIIQPLIVRKSEVRGFDIVAGERRFRAAKLAGLQVVPAVVRELSDVLLMEIALIENLQREDLNPIEIADAYANLIDKCELTQDELAQRVGQSRSHIANMLRLLNLPVAIRDMVSRGNLSMGHARALLSVEDKERQILLANQTVEEEWSVRKLETVIYEPKKQVSRETQKQVLPMAYRRYEEQVQQYLGTAVRIQHGKKRGKIEIEYFSEDDLERIMHLMLSRTQ
ncbi:ParB/RepB/Spo0J family partition protein [Alicyclobacillus fastidiosus]|uniref:ParB/RepB/Spo0J family partition protein n=1 Tax=Alicyclobacillus fastidiosus TaxID=392011 RepID=A0ABY6ZIK8_9BACL|nr:ParB/RepB/Spo0J family partition protein [Alicyclobacillus fastidiosus]WAH41951.1 ParB/RepB/Spo0J family partition protein [Alicyclobacillus fastidiosus]GMA63676.1 stage 0 sporulation protein J [Alicyclobacillus fastidiosus]